MSNVKSKDLDTQELDLVKSEADFLYTFKGYSYSDAMKTAERRIRQAVGKL